MWVSHHNISIYVKQATEMELSICLGKTLDVCVTLSLYPNIGECLVRGTEGELEHPSQDRIINAPCVV